MKRKTDSVNLIQWWISAGVLLFVVFTLLIWFSVVGKRKEQAEVENSIVQQMQITTQQVEKQFDGAMTYAATVADCISQAEPDTETALKMAVAAGNVWGMYDIVLCERNGTGYRLQGNEVETVQISEDIYVMSAYTDKEDVFYVTQDELHDRPSVIIVAPVNYKDGGTRYLLCYYDIADLQWLITDRIFGSDVFFVLLNNTGESIAIVQDINGRQNPLCKITDDYYALLRDITGDEAAVAKLEAGVGTRVGGASYLSNVADERIFIFAPMEFGKFTLLASVGDTYVHRQVNEEWSSGKTLIWGLTIAFLLFMVVLVAINIVNLIKNKNKHKDLEERADTDLLTGLYNKMSTERRIKDYMAEHPDQQGLLFILDVDNFKKINDTMGHAFGDEVLRTLGTSIRAEFRASDILGRTGGDEFTLFLCNMKDDEIIRMEAEKVERFFKNFKPGTYTKYAVTASIGAAVFGRDGDNFEDLYKAADNALYVAKKRGKNQLAFYGERA